MTTLEQAILIALIVTVWQLVDDRRHRRALRRPASDLRWVYGYARL
jgi:hypothetical protein